MAKPAGKGGGGGSGGGGRGGNKDTNLISGTSGDDVLVGTGSTIFTHTFDGGDGVDTLDLSALTSGVRIALQTDRWNESIAQSAELNSEPGQYWADYSLGDPILGTIRNIENVTGGSGDDLLDGNNGDNVLNGGAGHDWIWAKSGNDTLIGGAGMDVLRGNGGDDLLTGDGTGTSERDLFVFEDGGGHDTVTDFDPNTDVLVFAIDAEDWTSEIQWSVANVDGQDSLIGGYDNGASSITLLGLTSLNGVEWQVINDSTGTVDSTGTYSQSDYMMM